MGDVSETDQSETQAFRDAWNVARRVMKKRFRVLGLVHDAYSKMADNEDALGRIKEDLVGMLRLIRAWATRDYDRVPWRSILYAVAAIIYLVNPADAIPDALAGIGFVDDVAVITAVAKAIQKDLQQFREWDEEQPQEAAAESVDVETIQPREG